MGGYGPLPYYAYMACPVSCDRPEYCACPNDGSNDPNRQPTSTPTPTVCCQDDPTWYNMHNEGGVDLAFYIDVGMDVCDDVDVGGSSILDYYAYMACPVACNKPEYCACPNIRANDP